MSKVSDPEDDVWAILGPGIAVGKGKKWMVLWSPDPDNHWWFVEGIHGLGDHAERGRPLLRDLSAKVQCNQTHFYTQAIHIWIVVRILHIHCFSFLIHFYCFSFRFPQVLVLNIKRFKYTRHGREKLTDRVCFPLKSLHIEVLFIFYF